MSTAVPIFTNHPTYDSIPSTNVRWPGRGACPVAKKPILEKRESHQSVGGLVNANFGLDRPFIVAPNGGHIADFSVRQPV
jgi:hypothetical protein